MAAPFPSWVNTVSRVTLTLVALGGVGALAAIIGYTRSPYFTGQFSSVMQPIQFDHRHHVGDDRIDCRYCHSTVETSPSAGYPATAVCLNCHAQIWNEAPLLEPLRAAYFAAVTPSVDGSGPAARPVTWRRVHRLADYVYFDHSAHVNKGVGCVECHGRVDRMAEVTQLAPLTMGWCIECHRAPEERLRPPELVASMDWRPPDGVPRAQYGAALARQNDVHPRTNCTTCHR
jgi:hypothetical protein